MPELSIVRRFARALPIFSLLFFIGATPSEKLTVTTTDEGLQKTDFTVSDLAGDGSLVNRRLRADSAYTLTRGEPLSIPASTPLEVIYGTDDRVDIYAVT